MNIVITGASRGIGLAAAKLLDKPGNKLFLVASSKDSFKDTFQNASLYGADLTRPDDIHTVTTSIAQDAGTIDVLFNNAGVFISKKFEDYSEDDINGIVDLSLRSHMLVTKALLPNLKKASNPQIVFMSSMAAKSSIVGESAYAAAKAGITNFANTLRNEFGGVIRVSTIHAWGVDTWGAPNSSEFVQPEDVAATLEFIISRPATVMVESIDLSNPSQWRGGQAPWSPA